MLAKLARSELEARNFATVLASQLAGLAAGVYNADFDVAAARTVHRLRPADLWWPQTCSSLRECTFWQFGTNGKSDG
jgi:hypothetical protein